MRGNSWQGSARIRTRKRWSRTGTSLLLVLLLLPVLRCELLRLRVRGRRLHKRRVLELPRARRLRGFLSFPQRPALRQCRGEHCGRQCGTEDRSATATSASLVCDTRRSKPRTPVDQGSAKCAEPGKASSLCFTHETARTPVQHLADHEGVQTGDSGRASPRGAGRRRPGRSLPGHGRCRG